MIDKWHLSKEASDELLGVVQACGLRYDSSVFPCPPYLAAKAARTAVAFAFQRGSTR